MGFRKTSLLFLLLVCFLHGHTQQVVECLKCFDNPLEPIDTFKCTVPGKISKKVELRNQNYDFHYVLRNIQDPSTVTGFANWKFHNLGYQKRNLVLDADLQLPISIGGKRFGLNEIQIIPRFQVRIFNNDTLWPYGTKGDKSLPVRTPSAMPGIAYYHGFRNWWNKQRPVQFAGIYMYHHSNGQDGDEIDTSRNSKRVNLYNGNFSEDLVLEFIVGGRKNLSGARGPISKNINRKKVERVKKDGEIIFLKMSNEKEFFWKISYENHPKFLSNTVFDSLRIYGHHRLNIKAGLLLLPELWELMSDGKRWCSLADPARFERWRFTANISYILDKNFYRGEIDNLEKVKQLNFKRRMNISLTTYWIMGRTGFAAAFVQGGYTGSDNYNIYFNESYWHFKLGLAFTFFDQPSEKDHIAH